MRFDDAIARGDLADLKDELGDLLLQVVFHARIAEERGAFAFEDVATAIADKLERRHPHIFGDATDGGHHLWEQIKADERAAKQDASALAGVAFGLPALTRAEKLGKRAARVGFDWPDASGPRAKIDEELGEIDAAVTMAEVEDEIGDLLFSVANYARHRGIDPEAALRFANAKFERRFRAMEASAGSDFTKMPVSEMDKSWTHVKVTAV